MKRTIIGLTALVLSITGCKEEHNSNLDFDNSAKSILQIETEDNALVEIVKLPSGCKEAIDVRFVTTYGRPDKEHVLCKNNNGDLILYVKSVGEKYWTARQYVH